jgi:dynein heavy chain, axonemal
MNSQDMSGLDETAGPLEEIDFWKARNADLQGISKQLNKPSVKRITKILDLAKSSYISSFVKLAKQIQDGSKQAENNLKFLMVLKDPCHELADSKPGEIHRLLPRILNIIRVIWANSDYYNTRDRLTAMFRKLSNEIIRRCSDSINLDRIFDGYVNSSKKILNDCIECCDSWKDIYANCAKIHQKMSSKGWELDRTTIFAQIDAFIQRCRDLIEICDCQEHFANCNDDDKKSTPIFGGQKGPEITRNLSEIELTFNKHLLELRKVKTTILDVKATSWHEDYNKFRSAIKEMEVMVINVINSTFDTVTYVEQGVEILDAFMHLSARETIRRTLDKKTVEIYHLFINDLNNIKREITLKNAIIDRMHPNFAGAAVWASGSRGRIERQMLILNMAHFLPAGSIGDEARVQYKQTIHALDEYKRKCFNEWTFTLDNDPLKILESPLLKKSTEAEGMIDVNLNSKLLKLMLEVHYWERMGFEIPHYISDIMTRKEEIRNAREQVLTVVFDYNR